MDWDTQARAAYGYVDDYVDLDTWLFGAKWQRDALRGNESVRRMANVLHDEDHGEPLDDHVQTCTTPSCDRSFVYIAYARHVIDTMLGGGHEE